MTDSQCEHDYEPMMLKTKRDVLCSLYIRDSWQAFGDVNDIVAIKVCLKCQKVFDEIEEYRVKVMANLQDYEFVKDWPGLRERFAQYIYKESLLAQGMKYHGAA